MTAFDYAVLTVLAVSVGLGLWRGVVGELLALAAWVVAFLAAKAGAAEVAGFFTPWLPEPGMRMAAAYVAIVLGVLIVFAIGRRIVALLLRAVGLGLLDRLLGGAFGVLRGAMVVLFMVMLAGLTPLPAAEWWRTAVLAPPLETAVIAVKPWLPQEFAKRIKYR
jgi:membrane protein required for colicin V production